FAAALAVLITEASQSRQHGALVRLPMNIRLKIDLENQSDLTSHLPQSLFDVGYGRIYIVTMNTFRHHSDVLPNEPYDCRLTIRSKLKMIPKIKERISSSKKRLNHFKNTIFGKWLDLDDTNYDDHLLNDVLHHQRPGLRRAEFCLVTGFTCGKVVFPKYLDDGIPPFVRRLFPGKLKKLEKNKAGLDEVAKGKAAQPSDKSDKDSVTIGHLGELVPDKAAKGKAVQPSDKGDKELFFRGQEAKKVVPTFMLRLVEDLTAWDDFPWGEYYWEEFHNKVVNLIDKRKNNHMEFKNENPSKLPTYTIHGFSWALKASICQVVIPIRTFVDIVLRGLNRFVQTSFFDIEDRATTL
ncbi:hypothetical protein Tco_1256136, partial [Tanacetum coccineum]